MAQTYGGGPVTIVAVGITATSGAASAQVAIPVDSSGRASNYIRVASTNESYVKLGVSGVVATTGDILVQPADALILQVPKGITTIAIIQGPGPGRVNICALENS